VANSTERDAIGSPRTGFTVWDIARNWAERWNGSSWQVQNTAVTSSVADRNSAITAPFNGQLAYTSDTGKMWQRHSGAWREFPAQPRAQVRQTTLQAIATGVFTSYTFTTEDRDTSAFHDNAVNTDRLTLPLDGDYLVSGALCIDSGGYTGFVATRITKNGTVLAGSQMDQTVTAGAQWPITIRPYVVSGVAGDIIRVQLVQFSAGSLNSGVSSDVQSTACITYQGN
jgi:hypothetical protein